MYIFFFKLLAGSQVNALDKQRQTPLHVATVEDKAAILEVLLQNGANPDLVDVNLNNGKSFFFFRGVILFLKSDNCFTL